MADNEEQQVQPQQQEEEQQVAQNEPEPSEDQPEDDGGEPPQQTQEDAAAEEQEEEKKDGEEDGGGNDAAAEVEKEEEEDVEEKKTEEQPVVISHEDSPHWLTQEECMAKGVAEDQVSAFQHVYFQLAHSIKVWYDSHADQTFETDLVSLSTDEVDILLAAFHPGQAALPDLSDEQKEALQKLEDKLDESIKKFGEDGCFIRVNDRNVTDAILERNDAEFVARVREAVLNDLNLSNRPPNAYLVWGEAEKSEGAFRRGMTRLRQSFRRQRAPSTSSSGTKKEKAASKLKETGGEGEQEGEKKEEETEAAATEGQQTEEGEKDGKGGEGEATVTVEAQVEDPTVPAEGGGEEEKKEAEKEEEGDGDEQTTEPTTEPEPQTTTAEQTSEEPAENQEKEGEDEIVQASEEQETPKTEEEQPKKENLPPVRKTRPEPLDNEILRAFGRVITTMYRVASGKEAMEMLLRSGVVKQYLEQLKGFGQVEGVSVTVSVTRFHGDIAHYPGMVFRGFVYKGELTAITQKHDSVTFFPYVAQYKDIVKYKVKKYFEEQMKESLTNFDSYIVDLFVSTEKVYIVRVSPFYTSTGTGLYTWAEHGSLLTNPPVDIKIIETQSRKAPELYSGLQSQWSSMLDSVLTQKLDESRSGGPSGRSCIIL